MTYYIEISNGDGFLGRVWRRVWWSAAAALGARFSHQDVDEGALVRLAETSPHLLKDLGFWKSSDTIWTNGRTGVSVRSETVRDRLLRSGRV